MSKIADTTTVFALPVQKLHENVLPDIRQGWEVAEKNFKEGLKFGAENLENKAK
jgi:hypothetical protein